MNTIEQLQFQLKRFDELKEKLIHCCKKLGSYIGLGFAISFSVDNFCKTFKEIIDIADLTPQQKLDLLTMNDGEIPSLIGKFLRRGLYREDDSLLKGYLDSLTKLFAMGALIPEQQIRKLLFQQLNINQLQSLTLPSLTSGFRLVKELISKNYPNDLIQDCLLEISGKLDICPGCCQYCRRQFINTFVSLAILVDEKAGRLPKIFIRLILWFLTPHSLPPILQLGYRLSLTKLPSISRENLFYMQDPHHTINVLFELNLYAGSYEFDASQDDLGFTADLLEKRFIQQSSGRYKDWRDAAIYGEVFEYLHNHPDIFKNLLDREPSLNWPWIKRFKLNSPYLALFIALYSNLSINDTTYLLKQTFQTEWLIDRSLFFKIIMECPILSQEKRFYCLDLLDQIPYEPEREDPHVRLPDTAFFNDKNMFPACLEMLDEQGMLKFRQWAAYHAMTLLLENKDGEKFAIDWLTRAIPDIENPILHSQYLAAQLTIVDITYEANFRITKSRTIAYQAVASIYEPIIQESKDHPDLEIQYKVYLGRKEYAERELSIGQHNMQTQEQGAYQAIMARYQQSQTVESTVHQWSETTLGPLKKEIPKRGGLFFQSRQTPHVLADDHEEAHHDFVQMVNEPRSKTLIPLNLSFFGRGLKIHDVRGDGNCFFHAVADQLTKTIYKALTHLDLREYAIRYIQQHQEDFEPFFANDTIVEGFVYLSFEDYLEQMKKPNHFAEGLVIQALACALNIKINIFDKEGHLKASLTPPTTQPKLEINLLHRGMHYLSLRPCRS